jgi:hypothetical protein
MARWLLFPEEFDPFSLVIGTEMDIPSLQTTLEVTKKRFLDAEMIATEVDKSGNVAGEWLMMPSRFSVARIVFNVKLGYNPVRTMYYEYDQANSRKFDKPFSDSKIGWSKSSNHWLPISIEMKYEGSDGLRKERDFKIDWANNGLLTKQKFDYKALLVTDRQID